MLPEPEPEKATISLMANAHGMSRKKELFRGQATLNRGYLMRGLMATRQARHLKSVQLLSPAKVGTAMLDM